jgi:hypothetical protein
MFRKRKPENLLMMKPHLNDSFQLKKLDGCDYLVIPRTSRLEKIGIKWLHQSPEHRYRLDALGSFVLHRCNGRYTVAEIEEALTRTFGKKAEPTRARLVKFLQILDNNSVILFKKTSADEI